MQGTQVQSLVWEDPTCLKGAKAVHHNYRSLCCLEPMLCNKRSHRSERPTHRNWRTAPTLHN